MSGKPLPAKPLTEFDRFVEEAFGADGTLSRELPTFEPRSGQQAMAKKVADAFQYPGTLIVEAGTGIGKSLAYLIPAAAWSLANDEPVIVSTYTRALQEQLVLKDVPIVERVTVRLQKKRPLRVVSLKGRANYLCQERWEAERSRRNTDPEMARFVAKIRDWVRTSETGDKSELNLSEREDRLFQRLSASPENCTNTICRMKQGQKCFFARARMAAQRSDIVVVNHALLFSDQGAGGSLLPHATRLIVDEAHHLEAAATRQFSYRLTASGLISHVENLVELKGASANGLLPFSVGMLANAGAFSHLAEAGTEALGRIRTALQDGERVLRHARDLFEQLAALPSILAENSQRETSFRIKDSTRGQVAWSDIERTGDELINDLRKLESHCQWLVKALSTSIQEQQLGENGEASLAGATAWIDENAVLIGQIEACLLTPDPNGVYWLERMAESDGVALCSAPLDVGQWIASSIYAEKETIVLTSATLTVDGTFTHFRNQTGIEEAEELIAPSPFDYRTAALVYIVNDIAEPTHRDYQAMVEEAIARVGTALNGRTLALFTSHRQLRQTAEAIRGPLAGRGIDVLAQSVDAPPQELADRMRNGGTTVVLGAASMWEGIDIQGAGLSALVVVRLPFDVPSDPLFQARSEQYLSPFFEYSVPRAVLRFRQGFGRLIRSSTDRGICVVLDRRIITKAYGRSFIDSLPDSRIERGTLANLSAVAAHWIANGPGSTRTPVESKAR